MKKCTMRKEGMDALEKLQNLFRRAFSDQGEDPVVQSVLPGWSDATAFSRKYKFISTRTITQICRQEVSSKCNEDKVMSISFREGLHNKKWVFEEAFMLAKILNRKNQQIINRFKNFCVLIPDLSILYMSVIHKYPLKFDLRE